MFVGDHVGAGEQQRCAQPPQQRAGAERVERHPRPGQPDALAGEARLGSLGVAAFHQPGRLHRSVEASGACQARHRDAGARDRPVHRFAQRCGAAHEHHVLDAGVGQVVGHARVQPVAWGQQHRVQPPRRERACHQCIGEHVAVGDDRRGAEAGHLAHRGDSACGNHAGGVAVGAAHALYRNACSFERGHHGVAHRVRSAGGAHHHYVGDAGARQERRCVVAQLTRRRHQHGRSQQACHRRRHHCIGPAAARHHHHVGERAARIGGDGLGREQGSGIAVWAAVASHRNPGQLVASGLGGGGRRQCQHPSRHNTPHPAEHSAKHYPPPLKRPGGGWLVGVSWGLRRVRRRPWGCRGRGRWPWGSRARSAVRTRGPRRRPGRPA